MSIKKQQCVTKFLSVTSCHNGQFTKAMYRYVRLILTVAGIYRVCRFSKNLRYPEPTTELHLYNAFSLCTEYRAIHMAKYKE